MLWIRSGDGSFFGRVEIFAISLWKEFSNFEMLDAKIVSALNKMVSLEKQKVQKKIGFYEEDRSLSWSTTPFE